MPGLKITNFKGIFEKGSKFDLPEVFAETCKDFVLTHEGMLRKRSGYTSTKFGYTGSNAITNGLQGNIINMFELTTGRSETTAPNEAIKYLCQTDYGSGQIYLWNESTGIWTRIDNSLTSFTNLAGTVQKCTFLEENGAVRILAGNRYNNRPLWWGWCGERFSNAIMNNEGALYEVSAKFPTYAVRGDIPVATILPMVVTFIAAPDYAGTGVSPYDWQDSVIVDGTDAKYVTYRVAYQYDYKQWSPPSPLSKTLTLTASTIGARANLYFIIPSNSDQRLTGIKIYRCVSDSFLDFIQTGGTYNLIKQIDVNESYGSWDSPTSHLWPYNTDNLLATFSYGAQTFTLFNSESDDDALRDDLYDSAMLLAQDTITGTVYKCRITNTFSNAIDDQGFTVSSTFGLTNGRQYNIKVVSGWHWLSGGYYTYVHVDSLISTAQTALPELLDDLGISDDSYTTSNSKYGVMINGQMFRGNTYNNEETKEYLVTYGQFTSDGLFANDVHLKLNAFTAGRPIKGMSSVGNRLLLYGESFISRGIIPSGNELSWTFERLFEKFGLLAEYSLVNINGRDYFLATDWDIKEFDGVTPPRPIGGGIYDTLRTVGNASISYLSGVIGFFIPKLNSYGIRLQTGATTYEYWLYEISGKLGWYQFTWNDVFRGFFINRNGEALGFTVDNVFKLNSGTKDNAVNINPEYKSLPLAVSRDSIVNLESLNYHVKSNTTSQFTLYPDDAVTGVGLTLAINTGDKLKSRNLPMGTQCRSVQVQMALSTVSKTTNTQFDIDEIELQLKVSGDKSE